METTDLLRFVQARKMFLAQEPILLAISGGIDSMVMADLFHRCGYRFGIAHCNFGLRGEESEADEQFVRLKAAQLNVPFHTERFDTRERARRNRVSIQMAARELRYDWFDKIRQEHGYRYTATAHHLDDQAETFLINLARGTGIAGLHGIPVQTGSIIRPLMFTGRAEIEAYARRHKVAFRHDHSNDELKYTRNRVRQEIVPALKKLNPDFIRGLSETIRRISEFEQAGQHELETWSAKAVRRQDNEWVLDIGTIPVDRPPGPYLWKVMAPFGFNETQLDNLLRCLHGEGRRRFSSATHRLDREKGCIRISRKEKKAVDREYEIELFSRSKKMSRPLSLHYRRITAVDSYEIPATGAIASLDFGKLVFPLILRRWRAGDSFHPLGMRKRKKISDFFIDQKVVQKDREEAWLLSSGGQIVWILGHRIDHRYRVTIATREILRIEIVNRDT